MGYAQSILYLANQSLRWIGHIRMPNQVLSVCESSNGASLFDIHGYIEYLLLSIFVVQFPSFNPSLLAKV
jgi:hypothetical protein